MKDYFQEWREGREEEEEEDEEEGGVGGEEREKGRLRSVKMFWAGGGGAVMLTIWGMSIYFWLCCGGLYSVDLLGGVS